MAGQQLDEGGAGARTQSVLGLGLIQGQLQVLQVPRDLQQAEEAGATGLHACSESTPDPPHRGGHSLWGLGTGDWSETTEPGSGTARLSDYEVCALSLALSTRGGTYRKPKGLMVNFPVGKATLPS